MVGGLTDFIVVPLPVSFTNGTISPLPASAQFSTREQSGSASAPAVAASGVASRSVLPWVRATGHAEADLAAVAGLDDSEATA